MKVSFDAKYLLALIGHTGQLGVQSVAAVLEIEKHVSTVHVVSVQVQAESIEYVGFAGLGRNDRVLATVLVS